MPTRRVPINRYSNPQFTARALDVYRRARSAYDNCDTDRQTVALKACGKLCDELDSLLGRKSWDVEIFATIDSDAPQAWEKKLGATYVKRWHEAKQILSALERAAEAT